MFLEETLERMKDLFLIVPRAVAYDLHPPRFRRMMARLRWGKQ